MPIETRIFKNTRKSFIFLNKKFDFFKKNFSISVLFLFIGFFIGNDFGTFLNWLRYFIVWDGLLVFALLFIFEIISSIVYQNNPTFLSPPISTNKTFFSDFYITKNLFSKRRLFRQKTKERSSSRINNPLKLARNHKRLKNILTITLSSLKSLPIWRLLNCLKIGILFGFFIDALKVGS